MSPVVAMLWRLAGEGAREDAREFAELALAPDEGAAMLEIEAAAAEEFESCAPPVLMLNVEPGNENFAPAGHARSARRSHRRRRMKPPLAALAAGSATFLSCPSGQIGLEDATMSYAGVDVMPPLLSSEELAELAGAVKTAWRAKVLRRG